MFPSFPYLAETIAAERAADFQRDAAAYGRPRGTKLTSRVTDLHRLRLHHARPDVAATIARLDPCSASRAI